jgi:hypothetical protein
MNIYVIFFFPGKQNCLYPQVILATGTVQDTAKNTMDNVSIVADHFSMAVI